MTIAFLGKIAFGYAQFHVHFKVVSDIAFLGIGFLWLCPISCSFLVVCVILHFWAWVSFGYAKFLFRLSCNICLGLTFSLVLVTYWPLVGVYFPFSFYWFRNSKGKPLYFPFYFIGLGTASAIHCTFLFILLV